MDVFDYLRENRQDVVELSLEHALLVAETLALAGVIGVLTGVAVYRTRRPRAAALGLFGVFLTLPSYALFAIFTAPLGLGRTPAVVALTMYGLLPIARNTVVGLRGVPAAVVESATGMGMGRRRRLLLVELPLAWPVILTGIRVSAQLLIGIAAVAGVVNGPGLGNLILEGLDRVGTEFAVPTAAAGVLAIVVLAVGTDIAFLAATRLGTPRGLRH